ncbi:MAG: histidine phosphatase family protein [Pseudonocardia sp.]|nr:histidine phosphatase family protein [Pseudonocardia sp.]
MPTNQHAPGRIFLLRHGETEWSASFRHTGRTDVPLTKRGRELAVAAGQLLAAMQGSATKTMVYSSPMRRAVDTAQLAGLKPVLDEQLKEWDYGDYEGLTTDQIRESVPDWRVWSHPSPGGESAEEVGKRADEVLARYRGMLTEGNVVLVGHGHFSRVLTARWLGLPAKDGLSFRLDAGALTVLGDERGAPQLEHVNLVPCRR